MRRVLVLLALLVLAAGACGGEDGGDAGAPAPTAAPAPTTAPAPPPSPPPPPPAPSPPAPIGPELPAGLAGGEWEVLPTTRKLVALTFDCGANADGVRSIAATLGRSGAAATFFLTGRWAESFPQLAAALAREHAIGNHTQTHADLTRLGDAAARAEIERAGETIRRVTGHDPRPLFRFPYGARDERTIRLANELGYGSIRWTVDTLGWQGASAGRSAASVRARVLASLRPGTIVLMHVGSAPDGSTLDANALPGLVAEVRERGYRLVGLRELLG